MELLASLAVIAVVVGGVNLYGPSDSMRARAQIFAQLNSNKCFLFKWATKPMAGKTGRSGGARAGAGRKPLPVFLNSCA